MFDKQTYTRRRERLMREIPDALLLFVGNDDAAFNYAGNQYRFRQDSTFLYLFGLDTPGLAATIDTASGVSTLYADDVSMDDIVWTGPMPSAAGRAELCGADRAKPLAALAADVESAKAARLAIHYVTPYRGETAIRLGELLGKTPAEVLAGGSAGLVRGLVGLRSVKEQCEIDDMDRQAEFGRAMHLAAMRMAHVGVTENEIMARIEMEALRGGGPVSFPTICTTHGETLHNHGYVHTLEAGRLLLVDAGCESPNHYATDNTRTTPVGGRFTTRQREVYEIVLAANDHVRRNARPGVLYRDLHLQAAGIILGGLKDVGIVKGDTGQALEQGAAGLFMPHGLGHMMGLDVHDMENYGEDHVGYDAETGPRWEGLGVGSLRMARRLQEGFCVTNEPGIYFIPELIDRWRAAGKCADFIDYGKLEAYKDFGGIRIEDDLLITRDGCRIVGGARLPSTPDEVEAEALKGLDA